MKLSLVLLIGVLMAAPVGAATVTVSTCTAANVNAAIAAAFDGDVILLTCTGTVTWTSTVSIPKTKGISLIAQGGTNTPKGSASFPLTITTATTALSIALGPENSMTRVSGFKFTNGTNLAGPYIQFSGNGTGKSSGGNIGAFRIDNNYFDSINAYYGLQVYADGNVPLYGLIDNNTFHNLYNTAGGGIYGIQVWNRDHAANGCWGANGWTDSFVWGSNKFVFIEDNAFENISDTTHWMRHYVSSELGGRYVVRHNTFNVAFDNGSGAQTDLLDAHGFCLCQSNGVGARGGEIYANTFSGTQMNRSGNLRGGDWLVYDNVFNNAAGGGTPVTFQEYRAGISADQVQCSTAAACSSCVSAGFTRYIGPVGSSTANYPLAQQIGGGANGAGSSPSYLWNNMLSGVNQCGAIQSGGVQASYIQLNRDYFCSTSKPAALASYAAYTYPHPMRGISPPSTKTLTVNKIGSGTGTVAGSGINCGATCQVTANTGSAISMTATPTPGSTFAGWSGPCTGIGTCTFSLSANSTVVATFQLSTATVTVTKSGAGTGTVTGSGIVCGSTCSALANVGTVITLTAAATGGSTFTGWSGACSGTGTCTFTLSTNTAVGAVFTPPPTTATLTVTKSGTGTGTVAGGGINCGSTCQVTATIGTVITLTVTPTAGTSVFTGWTGACTGVGSCVVTLSASKSVGAVFALSGSNFQIWPGTTPAVTADPDTTAIEVGVKFQSDVAGYVTAIRFYKGAPNTGTHIGNLWTAAGLNLGTVTFTGETASGWQQATLPTAVPITAGTTYVVSYFAPAARYAVDSNYFVTAHDAPPLHGLSSGASGGNGVFRYGSTSSFPTQSVQSNNYWVDLVFATTAPPTVKLTVTKTGTGGGTVTSSPTGIACGQTCSKSYANGTVVTLTATPNTNRRFVGWSGGGCSGTGSCVLTITANTTVTAQFARH